jgi:dihydrofolate reductase
VNELERPIGTYLYGRRMYETMAVWETMDDDHEVMRDYTEIWRAADKIVYSRTLDDVSTARTRLESEFDPDAIRRLKEESDRHISIGGPGLAAAAFAAGLVDEIHLILVPFTVAGGKPALPGGLRLELLDERRFAGGAVHLHYAAA